MRDIEKEVAERFSADIAQHVVAVFAVSVVVLQSADGDYRRRRAGEILGRRRRE